MLGNERCGNLIWGNRAWVYCVDGDRRLLRGRRERVDAGEI